ncbi:arsenate reductase (glutaredoxin) [Acidiphilium sp. AL]|uniref:arsenate reductase (glutaredoxin) n=1 Tax=Acidiphilium sp. AL TaxID=2871704 RepID=UPI0021CB292B|nr:arsenate reductase (glutaredoxin) [Acidiphilium sp. AL]MCU4160511.1 arsenate reductase (glutaredoxin) [Acidiphilium sp. AL]
MQITIYHNPACGTSREVLNLVQSTGEEVQIVEYLKYPPGKEELIELIQSIGITTRDLLRSQEVLYTELGLGDAKWTDSQIIDIIRQYPILMNRPIVKTPFGARLCRPPETVMEILSKSVSAST